MDGTGNIYVADRANRTIRKVTSGGVVTTLAGSVGVIGTADGTGSAARFFSPQGVVVDSAGNVYVADSNANTIRKITSGGVVTTLAGTANSIGSVDGAGSAAMFYAPIGLALDSAGNIYVADYNNQTIRKVTSGGVVTTLAGTAGSTGSADGSGTAARFWNPQGVAVDGAGNVYVADSFNNTVRRITSGGVVTTLAGLADRASSVDGAGSVARFWNPEGLTVDGAGSLYVADSFNHSIRKITKGGIVTTLAGLAGSKGSTDGIGSGARFNNPKGVAVDNAGVIYVADSGNHTIRKIASDGVVTTVAGAVGLTCLTDGTGNVARFNNPYGVAVDGAGNLYVADRSNRLIRKITTGGVVTTLAGRTFPNEISNPYGVAVDGTGNVYVADPNRILKITSTGVTTTLAGMDFVLGAYADGTGSAARFSSPLSVAVDSAGNVYVADQHNSTIRKITTGGVVTTMAGLAGNNGTADGTGSTARFFYPRGVAVDSAGVVYVADSESNTIRRGTAVLVPVIAVSPVSRTLSLNSTAVFSISVASPVEMVTYQWQKDGVAITGATSATLVLPRAGVAQAGSYTCTVTYATGGSIVSDAATLTVSNTLDFGRIVNLSILTSLSSGEGLFTVGTVIGGAGTAGSKALLVRAGGPTLGAAPFNIPGTLPDPKLEVFSGSTVIASNDNWAGTTALSTAFTSVGAFPYVNSASRDAAYFNPALASGGYTIQVSDAGGATGTVIAELYDATAAASFTAATPRLINVSVLKQIPANGILTVGFVIGGATAKTVLIRAVGPTLGAPPFNVGGVMADPQLTLFSGQTAIATNDNWGGDPQLTTAGNVVGAFAFSGATSKDAMLLVTLAPGAYTAQASGVAGSAGIALVEVYEVP